MITSDRKLKSADAAAFEKTLEKVTEIFENCDDSVSKTFNVTQSNLSAYEEAVLEKHKTFQHESYKKISVSEQSAITQQRTLTALLISGKRCASKQKRDVYRFSTASAKRFISQASQPFVLSRLTSIPASHSRLEKILTISSNMPMMQWENHPLAWFFRGFRSIDRPISSFQAGQDYIEFVGLHPQQEYAFHSIAVHPLSGNIYVADKKDGKIFVFDPNLNYITNWSGSHSESRLFQMPFSISISSVGDRIAVTDRQQNCIHIFDENHEHILSIPNERTPGLSFRNLWHVAYDSKGFLYASDYYFGAVYKFDADGAMMWSWPEKKPQHTSEQLGPLCLSMNDEVVVGSCNNSNLYRLSEDGALLKTVNLVTERSMNLSGAGLISIHRGPEDGLVWMLPAVNRIQIHKSDDSLQITLESKRPLGIAFHHNGRLLVLSNEGRVYVY